MPRRSTIPPPFPQRPRFYGLIFVGALAAALVAPGNPRAASPGLPFTEDFADDSLKNPGLTTAAWTPAGATFAARTRLYRAFEPPYSGSDITSDIGSGSHVSIALGDVDGDGDLDVVVGNYGARNRLYLNDGTADPFSSASGTDITADDLGTDAVALGDVDGDGDLDLVAGNHWSPNRLYLNNGTASPFIGITGTDITADNLQTTSVALGDIDGDGDLDLVAGSNSNPNRLYLNNGTVSPWNGVTGTDITADNLGTEDIALGDIDGDGDLDVVAGNYGAGNRVYLNNGTALPFSGIAGADVTTDNLWTTSLALGDIDDDGDLDIVTGNVGNPNRTYLNNGSASPFNGVAGADILVNNPDPAYLRTQSVALGDMDGDGDLDLLAGNEASPALLYLNTGTTAPFGGVPGKDFTGDNGSARIAIALGDLNGDGHLDGIAARISQTTHLYLNNGGTNPFHQDGSEAITFDISYHAAVALGDMDGDGDLDCVVGNSGPSSRLYLNNGTAHPFAGVTGTDISGGPGAVWAVALGDVDGDGDLDLVTGNLSSPNILYLNNGTANPFAGVTGTAITADNLNTLSLALGDIDGDGDLDLVAGNNGGPVRLYLNDGTANPFSIGLDLTADNLGTRSVELGDIDGDGDLDLVTANASVANRFYLNNGTANPFLGVAGSDFSSDINVVDMALADVDGDGDLDLVEGQKFLPHRLYLNNGTASPFTGVAGSDITGDTNNTDAITVGDVDLDGDIDVVAGNLVYANRLYLNNGTADPFAGITGADIGSAANPWTDTVALGDVDGDGDLDLVTGNEQPPHRLFLNASSPNPVGYFHRDDIGADANTSWCEALGDVDGDGDLDLVIGNLGAPIRLYLANGTTDPWGGVGGSDVTSDAFNTASVALGDVDGDGDLDLVAGNVNTPNRLYLNNGTADPFGGVSGLDITADVRVTRAVALADMDGDGNLDLVAANQNTPARLYLNNGTANPWGGVTGTDVTGYAADTITMAVGDIDGDGDLDLVTGSISYPVRLTLNNGTASPFTGVTGSDVSTVATLTWQVALGDMDGDGDLDIVAGKNGNPSLLFLNNGTATPFDGVTGTSITADVNTTGGIGLGDMDADGDLDLVVGNDSQPNRLYRNNGTTNPFGGVTATDITSDITSTRGVAMGDVDRDGTPDIVIAGLNQPGHLYRANRGHAPVGRAVSLAVDNTAANVLGATLSVGDLLPANTRIDFWLSNNSGARWYLVRPGRAFFFPTTGSDLRWRAEMSSLSPVLAPRLQLLHLDQVRTAGDRVWQDINGDGIQNAGEAGVPGVQVALFSGTGAFLGSTLTDANGAYRVNAALNPGDSFRLSFFVPLDQVLTSADQGGDDTLDSDADPLSFQTPLAVFTGDIDQTRWDAGIYPACLVPDTPVVMTNIEITVPDGYSRINFTDGNWLSRVTGYNVRRSTDASLPKPTWPLLALNVNDQDLATPGKQWTDTNGNPPVGVVWFYEVAAYNVRCPAEGPY